MNVFEDQLEDKLIELCNEGAWIELQLHPGIGQRSISKEPTNIVKINKGRLGKFKDISESFYDKMVHVYDSRYA